MYTEGSILFFFFIADFRFSRETDEIKKKKKRVNACVDEVAPPFAVSFDGKPVSTICAHVYIVVLLYV